MNKLKQSTKLHNAVVDTIYVCMDVNCRGKFALRQTATILFVTINILKPTLKWPYALYANLLVNLSNTTKSTVNNILTHETIRFEKINL